MSHGVNEPLVVRHEYESESRFLARRLSTWAELEGPLVEDRALDAVLAQQPRRVLEVGCGTGDFSARPGRSAGVFVAVDLSHAALEELAELLVPGRSSARPSRRPWPSDDGCVTSGVLHSEEVVGRPLRTADSLHGFAAQQFGLPVASTPDRLGDVPLPFRATYRHCVIVGTTPA